MLPARDRGRYRRFGKLYFQDGKIIGFHLGHDFDAPVGSNVYATDKGAVLGVFSINGFGGMFPDLPGWVIFIEHTNKNDEKYIGMYGHVEPLVKHGDIVNEGDVIAKVADFFVDKESYPHLHYGYYENDKMPVLKNLGYTYDPSIKHDKNRIVLNVEDLGFWRDPLLKLK